MSEMNPGFGVYAEIGWLREKGRSLRVLLPVANTMARIRAKVTEVRRLRMDGRDTRIAFVTI